MTLITSTRSLNLLMAHNLSWQRVTSFQGNTATKQEGKHEPKEPKHWMSTYKAEENVFTLCHIWRVTSIKWGEVKRRRTGWHLIDDDLWTHGGQHYLHARPESLHLRRLLLPPFFFSDSFAVLSDKAPVSVRHVFFLLFFFFLDSLATTSFRRFQLWWSRVKMLRNTCNIPCGRSASQ